MTVLLSLSIALLAGLMMTRVLKPFNFPAVTAYLIAGVLVGPYFLGRLGIDGIGFSSYEHVESFGLVSDVAKTALLVVGGIGVVGIVVYGINKNRKIKLEEQKEQNEFTEKMMNVPLEKFSEAQTDKELEELMKKYNESESK